MLIEPWLSGPRILIVGPSWVGDMVMAQCLFKVLKRRYQDCQIDVLAPGWSRLIVAAMPEVQASIDMPVGHGSLDGACGAIWRKPCEASMTGPLCYRTPQICSDSLVGSHPRRTGWRGEMRYGLLNDAGAG